MAEHLLDRFDVVAGGHGKAGGGVAQVVRSGARHLGIDDGVGEPSRYWVRTAEVLAVIAREEQIAAARPSHWRARWVSRNVLANALRAAARHQLCRGDGLDG
jgi:hypothetical protein